MNLEICYRGNVPMIIRVQIKPEQRESNVRMVVRWVNINVDEFVANNINMSDIDFKDVFLGHRECFG
jgi:hypothetical protein